MARSWIILTLSPWVGRTSFLLVFGLLLVVLLLLPRHFIGQAESVPPWWRNVRVWAITVTVVQMLVYAYWG